MMRIFTKSHCSRLMLAIPAAVIGFLGTASGATIDVGTLLANPSFENGNQGSGCPVSWTCSGSPSPGVTSYTVTSAQYTPGSDGLSGGKVVPDGTHAASTPTVIEGSGAVWQSTGLGTYVAGNTYTISVWIGVPKTEPDGTTPVIGIEPDVRAFFLANGVTGSLPTASALFVNSASSNQPGLGQWLQYNLSFTAASGASYIGQNIGFEFYNGGTSGLGNNLSVNFDIAGTPVTGTPEPSSLLLAFSGLGLAALALVKRRSAAQN